jgi:hypothetical protein
MYEKPQYLTPDGYRRLPKRPGKKAVKQTGAAQARSSVALARTRLKKLSTQASPISKEAAKIIALAIRSMLSQK